MSAERIDLATPRRVHIVGIGGAGMSGLARLLVGLGHTVTGSDLADGPVAQALRDLGIPVAVGHDAANVGTVDLVTASPAVGPQNVELETARARGIPVATRAELLGAVGALRETLAVAGTHGKTSTSSMLAVVLEHAGRSPSWLVGADVVALGASAGLGKGTELVLEADESYGSFAELSPALCAVTNVEPDHLDHYGSVEALHDAFAALLVRSGTRVVNADDPVAAALADRVGAIRVGADPSCDLVVSDVRLERRSSHFVLEHATTRVEVAIGTPGRFNVHNAALAASVALVRGVDPAVVADALAGFTGAPRRFEFRGEARGATVVDDYAHLPGEVAAVVATARAGGWHRVVAVFQPHRFTRTAALAPAFAGAFDGVDLLFVTDVYAAGERPIPGVTGRLVADAVAAHPGAPEVRYVGARDAVAAAVAKDLADGDLLLTMGAGDLTSLADELRALR